MTERRIEYVSIDDVKPADVNPKIGFKRPFHVTVRQSVLVTYEVDALTADLAVREVLASAPLDGVNVSIPDGTRLISTALRRHTLKRVRIRDDDLALRVRISDRPTWAE